MYQKSNEQAQRASEISDTTTSVKTPYKPPAHEVISIFLMAKAKDQFASAMWAPAFVQK